MGRKRSSPRGLAARHRRSIRQVLERYELRERVQEPLGARELAFHLAAPTVLLALPITREVREDDPDPVEEPLLGMTRLPPGPRPEAGEVLALETLEKTCVQ